MINQRQYTYCFFLLLTIVGIELLGNINLQGQTISISNTLMTRIVRIDSLFKGYGVIFDSSYTPPIDIKNVKNRIAPNEADIVLAEKMFRDQYNVTNETTESRKGAKFIADVNKYFQKFNRQYIAYNDNEDKRNLIIHLFDYSKKRTVKKYIGDSWKNKLVVLFAEDLPFEIVTYRVNLTEGKLYATY